jgi:hypothetical protein
MTIGRATAALFVVVATLAGSGCGARRVAAPLPMSRTLVVLLADPEGGSHGRARLSHASGAVDLSGDRDSTEVRLNQPPSAPRTFDSLVDVRSHGEADLLVPTSDNTYERRNRRVEVAVR